MSSGDAVKVYLYGLFLCQNPSFDQSLENMANTLNMTEKEICDYFSYWEEFELVTVLSKAPLNVQYNPARSSAAIKPRKFKAEKYGEFTKSLQALINARMISTGEYTEYFSIMETYGIKPDAMLMIVSYCVDMKGAEIGYRYISKVAKDFGVRGLVTVEKVERELAAYLLRSSDVERILKALSLKRQVEIEDSNYYKKWTQEMGFDPDNIVFAASNVKKGGMAKLDQFLLELYAMKSFSKEDIKEYVNKKQAVYDLAVKINKALSVYVEVIDTVVDTFVKKWLSYGFTDQSLLFIASHCFKIGKNTLQDMDELIETLRTRGCIDLSSVGDYFEREKKTDEYIKKLLLTAGVNRRPNQWDRENVNTWRSWNFSEDMILEAAKIAAGKSSPIAYINGILSNWKNNDVYSVEKVGEATAKTADDSQENYNREYERRRAIALSRAQKNSEKAMSINGFAEAYGKLNGMEKDLAFAEYSKNEELIKKLENEQTELIAKVEKLLSSAGLTLDDLSPKYQCEKCNDTGYVGTHRCDCFKK